MTFLTSMAAAIIFIAICRSPLKKKPDLFYLLSLIIVMTCAGLKLFDSALPKLPTDRIMPVLIGGGFAGALFIIVMITGALPNGSWLIRFLMPIRGALSIIASIFSIGHNLAYGKTYFLKLLFNPGALPTTQNAAAICSLIMILIMLPLFITSFPSVRKQILPKQWKKLQRTAYIFYLLLFVHIMLLTVPKAAAGSAAYQISVLIYGTIFIWYAAARVMKYFSVKYKLSAKLKFMQCIAGAVCLCISIASFNAIRDADSNRFSKTPTPERYAYVDGTYTGTAFGNGSNITVEVSIQNNIMTQIRIITHGEDEPYISDAAAVINNILLNQSTEVDSVSGATYSSEGIKNAINIALNKASGK